MQALEKLIAKKKWKRPKNVSQQVKWVASEDLFTIEKFVVIEKKDREEAERLEQSIRDKIQHESKQKKLAEQERLEQQRIAAQKRLEEQKLAEQRRIDEQNRKLGEQRRIAEEKANQILANYFKKIPYRIVPTLGVAFTAWLVIGSGGCIARTLSAPVRVGQLAPIWSPEAYGSEGITAAMIVIGISAFILAVEFIQALIKYTAVKSKIK